jgi:photosystem II stability/assembly factor-like uncharacterized protein
MFKSTDGGATWSNIGLGNTTALPIDFVKPNIIYAGTSSSGLVVAPGDRFLLKSTDGGTTWSNSSSPVDFDISLLVMDPTSPKTLYAGSEGQWLGSGSIILWKSTDDGTTWSERWFGNPGLAPYGLVIDPTNPQTLYAPGDLYANGNHTDSGLFKSTDGGANWSATGLTNTFVRVVAIDPFNPNTLYVGTTYYDYDLPGPLLGLFKSTDSGSSWFAINNGLTDLIYTRSTVAALTIDPVDPNILYAGTSGRGIFRSADGGASWGEFNSGLTNLSINALAIDRIGRHLYAATGAGVFAYQYTAPCAGPLSPADQAFDSSGGAGFVTVTAGSECSWTAASFANWISLTSDSSASGSEMVTYFVTPNESTASRIGIIGIAARFLTVRQEGVLVRINSATVSGKKLFVTGENFDAGAVILRNGVEQKTKNDPQNPQTALIGKKAGKGIKPGDRLQVRNPNGSKSEEFAFTG